jgi:hypothetical protein
MDSEGWRRFLAALLAGGLALHGQADRLERFRSALLDRSVEIALHVPAAAALQSFRATHPAEAPALVLFLPGAWDGPGDLLAKGLFAELSRREAAGARPALWVAVAHFRGWYADRKDGRFPYARFLMEELLPALETRFAVGGRRADRAVAGLSMGGFGALNLAGRTGAFGRTLALSPALVEPPFKGPWLLRRSLARTFDPAPEAFASWNPWRHLGGQPDLRLACGTSDTYGLAPVTEAFARKRREAGLPVALELRPGGHDWATWSPMLLDNAAWLAGEP